MVGILKSQVSRLLLPTILLLVAITLSPIITQSAVEQAVRPNILLIITDDQRYGTVGEFMPATQSRIFDAGVTFEKAYATTPACCPSRSSIFTGLYAARHGVRGNKYRLKKKTFMHYFHESGYFTGLVGKYLNSWNGTPRPEFDYWAAFPQGSQVYVNPELNVNGVWERRSGYMTYLLRDHALTFLNQAKEARKPFLLVLAFNAPHTPTVPAPEDENLYKDYKFFDSPSFNVTNSRGKPKYINNGKIFTSKRVENLKDFRIRQLQTLRSVDRSIDTVLNKLEEEGQLENTIVFFISDNGLHWGEHGLVSKDCPYEESVHVPFAVRYAKAFPVPHVSQKLVANIDIAPTVYELAGISPPETLDGVSLVSTINSAEASKRDILIQGWRNIALRKPFAALHNGRFVYIENEGDIAEFYDLERDPYEMKNLAVDATDRNFVDELKARLKKLRDEVRSRG